MAETSTVINQAIVNNAAAQIVVEVKIIEAKIGYVRQVMVDGINTTQVNVVEIELESHAWAIGIKVQCLRIS